MEPIVAGGWQESVLRTAQKIKIFRNLPPKYRSYSAPHEVPGRNNCRVPKRLPADGTVAMSDDNTPYRPVSHPSRRTVLGAAAGVGAATLATTTVSAAGGDDDGDADDEEADPFAAVEFTNQYSDGSEIVVDATTLSHGGYVAIHDASLFDGAVIESVVGVSHYLEPGVHYQVPITMFDVPGADFDQSNLDGTTPLVAMPHVENSGNETYTFVASEGEYDGPYAEAGLPVVDAGFVTVDDADEAADPFATVDFENQAVTDDGVVVRDVTLSDGGFVALHDAGLLGGDALGSVVGVSEYLEPGRHQSVQVAIADPASIAEVELPARPLLPMPHLDTNDNGEIDFIDSEGAEDGPYTKAGQAVVDAGLVTIED